MKTQRLGQSALESTRLGYGCWRIAETEEAGRTTGRAAVLAAFEAGVTLFDHADLYCGGRAESAFGAVLREVSGMRDRVLIATKCGIRLAGEPGSTAPFRYDFSAEHILRSCEGSLRRLGIETIDLYQLHRPDWLMNPEDVAAAFTQLFAEGKVREFGVSNFRPSQVEALQRAFPMPLVANQVEISLACLACFNDGTLDQCLAENITPMAWSPLAGGKLADGPRKLLPWQEAYRTDALNAALDELAKPRGVSRAAVALAWLLKHPARIIPLVGSTNPASIRACLRADDIELSREEWYSLLELARGERLP